jgi:hypothetical protein
MITCTFQRFLRPLQAVLLSSCFSITWAPAASSPNTIDFDGEESSRDGTFKIANRSFTCVGVAFVCLSFAF